MNQTDWERIERHHATIASIHAMLAHAAKLIADSEAVLAQAHYQLALAEAKAHAHDAYLAVVSIVTDDAEKASR